MAGWGGNNAARNNQIRKALPALFPGVMFTVKAETPSRRNGHRELFVSWMGGPSCEAVQTAFLEHESLPSYVRGLCITRINTPEEQVIEDAERRARWAAEDAQQEAERPAREAAAAAAKAANRAAGKAKAAETRQRKAAFQAKLEAAFPEVAFSLASKKYEGFSVTYTGGPSVEQVQAVDPVTLGGWRTVVRLPSEEDKAAAAIAAREVKLQRYRLIRRLRLAGVDVSPYGHWTGIRELQADLLSIERRLKRAKHRKRLATPRKARRNRRLRPGARQIMQLMLPLGLPSVSLQTGRMVANYSPEDDGFKYWLRFPV